MSDRTLSRTPRSGIEVTSDGDRLIPASTRADGSLRKEIKIRPGYRPPEDVEIYKNRTAEAWKTRDSDGVPGALSVESCDPQDKGAASKNAKRREARKRAKATGSEAKIEFGAIEACVNEPTSKPSHTRGQKIPSEANGKVNEEFYDSEAETEKQARSLKKKLRQARELKEKKDCGEGLLPEQFAKVIKIQELIRQLDALGFDEDGARRAKDVR